MNRKKFLKILKILKFTKNVTKTDQNLGITYIVSISYIVRYKQDLG